MCGKCMMVIVLSVLISQISNKLLMSRNFTYATYHVSLNGRTFYYGNVRART